MKLNVGCGPHYAPGFTNTDLVRVPGIIEPDLIVTADNPFPFDDGTVTHAHLGHVLEHVPWAAVPDFLDELARVLTDDGVACFVGPDALEVIDLYREGREPWSLVCAIIEGTGAYSDADGGWAPLRWDSDRHHWNSHEARVAEALDDQGWSVEVIPRLPSRGLDMARLAEWPVVSGTTSQFSIVARP